MDDLVKIPCGCVMWTDTESNVMVFEPHAEDCDYYLYVRRLAAEEDIPTTEIEI